MENDLLAGMEKPCSLVAVFPHPDDESFAAGGVLALYGKDPQVKTVSLCLSKGGKSSALDKVGLPEEREPLIREREYLTATAILGVDRAQIWEYMDQEIDKVDQEKLKAEIRDFLRECWPAAVITYGPDGITGHPDHVACSRLVEAAAREAGAQRLFMVSAPRMVARWVLKKDLLPPTHGIDIRSVYPVKLLALKAHATQMLISREPMLWVGVIMRMFGKEYFHRVF